MVSIPLLCQKWIWSSWSLSTLEWKSTASITAMFYSLSRCCQRSSTLQVYVCLSTRQRSISSCKDTTARNAGLHWSDIWPPNSPDWIQWIIKSTVLCSRECMNVVWTVWMRWSCASLKFGTVCSRTLLTRPSTSGESNWEHACMQMDNIVKVYCERVWLTKVMNKWNISNFVYSQKRCFFTTELVIFTVLKFPR